MVIYPRLLCKSSEFWNERKRKEEKRKEEKRKRERERLRIEEEERRERERLRIEEEERRAKERDMKRVYKNHKHDMEKIRQLTEENKSLKCENNSLNLKINNFERMVVFQEELKQKAKYYKDKYLDLSKMTEALRKEVRKTGDLERETFAQREGDTSLICSVCKENRLVGESIEEKFELMHDQIKAIRNFSRRYVSEYNRSRV